MIKNESGGVSREHLNISAQVNKHRPQFTLHANPNSETYLKKNLRMRSLAGQTHVMRHGDTFILGNPENPYAVRLQFRFPKSLPVRSLLLLRNVTLATLGLSALLLGTGAGWMALNWSEIPGDDLRRFAQRTQLFYDRNGTELTALSRDEVEPIENIDDIPDYVGVAVLASEDRRFNFHLGIDPIGIFTALRAAMLDGGGIRGASTITQQLARIGLSRLGW